MSAETYLENHAGDPCSNCRASYEACTRRILDQHKPACCGSCMSTDTHNARKPTPPAYAAVVWIDTDGKFHVANHDHEETAEDQAEFISERGVPVRVITREDFIASTVGGA